MPTTRLADRQIRAAATQAALRLDVRGPVSKALGKTGIAVTPADLEAADPGEPALDVGAPDLEDEAPTKTAGRRSRGLQPVRKPFAPEPWPTQRAPSRTEPPKTLSGLTAGERRVHRILLGALARENSHDGLSSGLSFAEKKNLPALDLAFIDNELAAMATRRTSRASASTVGLAVGVVLVPLVALVAVVSGVAEAVLLGAAAVAVALGAYLASTVATSSTAGPREQVYRALRELALLVDDAPVSAALERADSLIDHFAGADDASSRTGPSKADRRTAARS